ncbi:hypothetical protein T484DRAFT_1834038 [Baffinella frigidus]|nr:hypothetical protein T484DRAFT_1834038 [Cryptophyta sp. CCMP2293]
MQLLYPSAWKRWYELFICGRECPGFPFLHKDMCSTHALTLQVQGIKRFYLFPPGDSPHLYPTGSTHSQSSISHADVVSDSVDAEAFPLYKHATMLIADIRLVNARVTGHADAEANCGGERSAGESL